MTAASKSGIAAASAGGSDYAALRQLRVKNDLKNQQLMQMNNSDDLVSFDEAEIMAMSNPISKHKAY